MYVQEQRTSSMTDLLSSVIALSLTFLMCSTFMFSMVSDKLITADMTSNPRYAITFPALEYIEDIEEVELSSFRNVIASKILSIMESLK